MNPSELEYLVRELASAIDQAQSPPSLEAIELARCAVFLVTPATKEEWPGLTRELGKMGYIRKRERERPRGAALHCRDHGGMGAERDCIECRDFEARR